MRNISYGNLVRVIAFAIAGLACPAAAQAQSAGDGGAKVSDVGLREIVVTATRRAENVQNIPLSVSAVAGDRLAGAGVADVRQLMQYVPGFVGGKVARGSQPSIRGVTSTGISVGDESNVATYVDGIYQPDSYLNNLEFGAVDRVEVLRGPQGTLFGRNATGGLVNIITPDPKFTAAGSVGAGISTMRGAVGFQGKAYYTAPLSDKVAVNFALAGRHQDGFIDNLTTHGREGVQRVYDGFVKVLFQPSSAAKLILTVGHGYLSDNQGVAASIYTDAGGRPVTVAQPVAGAIIPTAPFTTAGSVRPESTGRKTNVSLRTQFDVGAFNIETATGYWRTKAYMKTDTDMSSPELSANENSTTRESISQEVRFVSNGAGPLKWIAGAYYFHEKGTANINVWPAGYPTTATYVFINATPETKTDAYALFAEANYEIAPGLKVLGGVRYSAEDRAVSSANIWKMSATSSPINSAASAKMDNSKVTYRASAQYKVINGVNVYFTYSTGFKSGVFNSFASATSDAGLSAAFAPVRPETINGYEAGVKADLSRQIRVNIAGFNFDYNDLQVSSRAPSGVGFIIQNAAQAKIKGVEFEGWFAPVPHLNLHVSGTYLDAKYSNFPLAPVFVPNTTITTAAASSSVATDVSGTQMIRAPKFAFSVGGNWDHDFDFGKVSLDANLFHTSAIYQGFGQTYPIASHERVNASLSFQPSGTSMRFGLYAENLTNNKSPAQLQLGATSTYVNYEEPRKIGLRASVDF